jgi:multidrug efflux system membrane fusion protein
MTLETLANAVVVPNAAMQTGQAGQFVFVVKPDMTVEMRMVKVGSIFGDKTVIEQGLRAGETVVTDGQIRLTPGALVQIKTAL